MDTGSKTTIPVPIRVLVTYISSTIVFLAMSALSACNSNQSYIAASTTSGTTTTATATPTTTSTPAVPSTTKAVRIILSTNTGGSFANAPSQNDNTYLATTIYNPDNSTLATTNSNGTTSSTWPTWFTSFTVSIADNHCAMFAATTEQTEQNCCTTMTSSTTCTTWTGTCGAPSGQYRISEADCSGVGTGSGLSTDPITMVATFNRSTTALGIAENILVVLEYAASALDPVPTNPSLCFSSGTSSCADFTWNAYLKHSSTEQDQPFLMLIPPMVNSFIASGGQQLQSNGTNLVAKQFILPLAADSGLNTLQISRINSNFTASPTTFCKASGSQFGDSPLCAGVIFYSITFYRI